MSPAFVRELLHQQPAHLVEQQPMDAAEVRALVEDAVALEDTGGLVAIVDDVHEGAR